MFEIQRSNRDGIIGEDLKELSRDLDRRKKQM
jgi:hypothetical protein